MNAPDNGRSSEPDVQVLGYCVYCRMRRPMHGAIQVRNRRGGRDLKGHCAVCGKAMYRLGGWDAVVSAPSHSSVEEPVKAMAFSLVESALVSVEVG